MAIGDPASPPLVFIHGTPWSSVEWQALASSLSSRFHVHIYDHPGFGYSPPPERLVDATDREKVDLDGSLALRAQASAALLRHWNFRELPHVVAHDNGGLVSLRLLLEYRIFFASLCLIDVVAIGPFGLPFFRLVAENEKIFKALPRMFLESFVRTYVRSATHQPMPKEIEDMLCEPWLAAGTQGPDAFLREMVQAHNRDTGTLENQYARVGQLVPTKIIWGKDDAWLPVDIATRLKKALNASEITIIDSAGHLVQYDQPAKLALEVGLWLCKCEESRA